MVAINPQERKKSHETEELTQLLFGPIGEAAYTPGGAKRIRTAYENGKLNPNQRKELWSNLAKFERILQQKMLDAGSTNLDIATLMKEAMWEVRKELGTAPRNDKGEFLTWQEFVDLKTAEMRSGKFDLDIHHLEVKEYAQRLIDQLFQAGKENGQTLEQLDDLHKKLDIIPAVMDIHDMFKFALHYTKQGQDEPDHRTFVRYFIQKYFAGQRIEIHGQLVPIETVTSVDYMAEVALRHENLYEENDWSKQRQESEFGLAMGTEFIVDTMTNAVNVIKNAEGQWVIEIDNSQLARFMSLTRRHLRVYTDATAAQSAINRDYAQAKAFEPGWIVGTIKDFVGIVQSWEDAFKVIREPQTVKEIISEALEVFFGAQEEIQKQVQENPSIADGKQQQIEQINIAIGELNQLAERLHVKTEAESAIRDEMFLEKVAHVLTDRHALVEIANLTGIDYAKRNQKNPELFTLDPDESREMESGRDLHDTALSESSLLHIELGRNSVGLLSLIRIVGLIDAGILKLPSQKESTPSIDEILQILATESGSTSPEFATIVEEAARNSHAGWVTSQIALGREDRITMFDTRQKMEMTSDWIQVKSAAAFLIQNRHLLKQNAMPLTKQDLLKAVQNRQVVVQCAQYCHAQYCETQLELRKAKGYSQHLPWMANTTLFTPEETEKLMTTSRVSEYGDQQLTRRFRFVANTVGLAALQEGVAFLAQRREPPISASQMLRQIVEEKLTADEVLYLGTLQKSLYLQVMVMRNRFTDNRDQVESLFPDVQSEGDIQQVSEDFQQILVAAQALNRDFIPNYYKDREIEPILVSADKTKGRPTELVTYGAEEKDIPEKLKKLGILANGPIDHVEMLSGGAVLMDATSVNEFELEMVDKFVTLVKSGKRVLIVTGGTNTGFMEVAGKICEKVMVQLADSERNRFQVLGVTPARLLTFDDAKVNDWDGPYGAAVGHTHHLLVARQEIGSDGNSYLSNESNFGDELESIMTTIRTVRDTFTHSDHKVTVEADICNGGGGTADEVRGLMDLQADLTILKDSHRIAHLIAIAKETGTLDEYRQKVIAENVQALSEYDELREHLERVAEHTVENTKSLKQLLSGNTEVASRISQIDVTRLNELENTKNQTAKSAKEVDNIFRLLSMSDPGVETEQVWNQGTPKKVIIKNNRNFQIVKDKISQSVTRMM